MVSDLCLKGVIGCKIHFYQIKSTLFYFTVLFEHKSVIAVCVLIHPINDKNPPSAFF